eukprot:m.16570 g.16570  ORF g.16570 m.16570 type:complete len:346 (-) comp3154_c0_seq1:2733-3770(-)
MEVLERLTHTIAVVGATPCVQATIYVEDLAAGEVNRAHTFRKGFGGKGQLVARAACTLKPASATVVQFIGGGDGELVCRALDHLGIPHSDVGTAHETRTCTTVIATRPGAAHRETELIGPAPPTTRDEVTAFRAKMSALFESDIVRGLAIVGTCPESCGPSFYGDMAVEFRAGQRGVVLLDNIKSAAAVLATGCVDIFKVNVTEFRAFSQESCPDEALPQAMVALARKHAIPIIALTDGGRPARIAAREGTCCQDGAVAVDGGWVAWEISLPRIDITNAIGAGDTTSAGLLLGLLAGLAPVDAFRLGLAAGSASCLTDEAAKFHLDEAVHLLPGFVARPVLREPM